jgi:hypothetical protein
LDRFASVSKVIDRLPHALVLRFAETGVQSDTNIPPLALEKTEYVLLVVNANIRTMTCGTIPISKI